MKVSLDDWWEFWFLYMCALNRYKIMRWDDWGRDEVSIYKVSDESKCE